jgi:2-polyprenyl-6-methoxyphenol hydroxylase-like FAD-dependent oxidoreductase
MAPGDTSRRPWHLTGHRRLTMPSYDAIVVGARCAGASTAMLLSRLGHRVLLVDRATFPSDTISTHLVHPPGVDALRRWGLLDRLRATGCPPIHTYAFDLGPLTLAGAPGPGGAVAYSPRRTILDALLVEAAAEAGVEVRTGFTVDEILFEDGRAAGIRGHGGGGTVVERGSVVVGADGQHSLVAKAAGAACYHERPPLEVSYYSYWSGLPMDGRFEAYDRGDRAWAAFPTHDDLTLVIAGWPYAEFEANRSDVERHYLDAFERAPSFADRLRGARREARFFGAAVPNFFRKPFGPGWALVGDAGYTKDFITAQGISDAFRDADLCAAALDDALGGRRPFDDALGAYQRTRDEQVLPTYEFTCAFASFTPPTEETQQLYAAMAGNAEAMDGFVQVFSGVRSPADFFSDDNVGRIMAAASGGPAPT